MMNFLIKHMRIVFIITIIAFICVTFMGFGTYLFVYKEDFKTAITVNGTKIDMKLFNLLCTQLSKIHKELTNEPLTKKDFKEIKIKAIQILVQNEIYYQQSKLYGIVVTDKELKLNLENSMQFKKNNIFDIKKYYLFLQSIQMTPKEYENLIRKQIAGSKVKMTVAYSVKLWNYELETLVNQGSSITEDILLQSKINTILNEWYSNVIKNSEIVINKIILE
ncbi:MAG: SurA N-terminal domain-containing protein [Endomicrobium sp.]|nr:SurA N-terminal domain-containing protein [Endomicrobium sp.]